jgi:photosystem II stability/assembly factor-like uncharacterized protein
MKSKTFLKYIALCMLLSACKQEEIFFNTVNVSIYDSGMGVPLNKISFANSTTGFISTTNGKLLKTTDQGSTWAVITVGAADLDLRWLSTPGTQAIYVSGETSSLDGQCYKSINLGTSWTLLGGNWDYELIDFPSVNRGYMTSTGELYRTSNGGSSWSYVNGLITIDPQVMAFCSNDTGVIVGFDNDSYITDNGGTSVSQISALVPSTNYYPTVDIKFVSSSKGYAVNLQGGISMTTDAGQTWSGLRYSTDAVGEDYGTTSVDAFGNTVCAVGESTLLISKDGGSTFNNYYNTEGLSIRDTFRDVAVVSANKIIAIGESGKIYTITF